MPIPALEMQYSPRLVLLVSDDDRTDVDDHRHLLGFGPLLLDHDAGHVLGQEKRPLEIGVHDLIITGFAHFQQIHPLARSHTGIIDQQIDPAKLLQHRADQFGPIGGRS